MRKMMVEPEETWSNPMTIRMMDMALVVEPVYLDMTLAGEEWMEMM